MLYDALVIVKFYLSRKKRNTGQKINWIDYKREN